jgi:hypothetical protein
MPIPVATRYKARTSGYSLAETAGLNPAWGTEVSLVSVVFCQVEVSATDRSLVQGSYTDCSVWSRNFKNVLALSRFQLLCQSKITPCSIFWHNNRYKCRRTYLAPNSTVVTRYKLIAGIRTKVHTNTHEFISAYVPVNMPKASLSAVCVRTYRLLHESLNVV